MVLLEVENNAEIRKFENNVTLRELMYGYSRVTITPMILVKTKLSIVVMLNGY